MKIVGARHGGTLIVDDTGRHMRPTDRLGHDESLYILQAHGLSVGVRRDERGGVQVQITGRPLRVEVDGETLTGD